MRFIPTRVHGMMDYGVGLLLIIAPWILGFNNVPNHWAVYVPVALGVSALLYSLLTDYELAVVRVIPMPVHLAIDVMAGLVLAISPWLFGFADQVYLPHVIFGVLEIGAGLMTRTVPDTGVRSDITTGQGAHPVI